MTNSTRRARDVGNSRNGMRAKTVLTEIGPVQIEVPRDRDSSSGVHYLHQTHYVEQSGYPSSVGAEFVEVNGIFATRDGRYIMLEAGPPYQKLLNGYLNFFDCGNKKQSFAREVAKWNAEDLEQALTNTGLPACRAFTRKQWLAHPQGKALAGRPPIEIVKVTDGDPVPFRDHGDWPLDGVRVLDFTHVLAGPRSARTLAEYGAEVLHISSPWFAATRAQHLGVDVGKYDAYLDLRYEKDMATMRQLAATADVFASTYCPAVNERFGLLPERLAAASERGIVYMSANAYGHSGSWKDRPGFDQNGQVAARWQAESTASTCARRRHHRCRAHRRETSAMRYTLLGNSGLRVSEVALGTMTSAPTGAGAPHKARPRNSSSCSLRQGAPSLTPPTGTPTAPPSRSSVACWPLTGTTSWSAPSTPPTSATATSTPAAITEKAW